MVRTVKEAIREVVEGKKQNLTLRLRDLYDYNEDKCVEQYVTYENISGYQLSGEWVAIMEKDGTTHAYPKSEVKHVKHFSV